MTRLILHITTADRWSEAQASGSIVTDSLESEGFVHCSLPTQVIQVANWFYRDVRDLVLCCVDPNRLTSPLRWEPSADAFPGDFPHVYGPITTDAVVDVMPWSPGPEGFVLPERVRHRLDG